MKIVSLFLLVLCMSLSASAQDEDVLRPKGSNSSNARRGSSSSSSSTPIIFGIEAGLNFNMFSQTMSGLVPDSRFALNQSGTGISPFLGVFMDFEVSRNLGVQIKLAYDQKKFGNSKDAIRDCGVVDQLTGITTVVDANITGEYTNTISYIDLTPQLRWNITPELVFLIGPTAHFQLGNGSGTYTETVSSDGQCFYNPGTPQQSKTITATVDSLNANAPRFGIQLDLGYKFPLSNSISLVPKVGYQYLFTKISDGGTFQDDSKFLSTGVAPIVNISNAVLNSLQFTLGLWFQL